MLAVIAALAGLLIDALWSGSVWIKGSLSGTIDYRRLAHKRERSEDPFHYWFAVAFYALALVILGYVRFNE